MSNQNQNFFDIFMLVLGILIGVTFGIFLLARFVAGNTQEQWVMEDTWYQDQVLARIAPVGQVTLPGEEAQAGAAAQVTAAEPVKVVMSGPQVYNTACLACHGAGIGGAPKFGDAASWGSRIAQGSDTLNKHALEGYTGSAGYMPPKGGRLDLSDEEIIAAVEYMVTESR